jgi:hypothetical protein
MSKLLRLPLTLLAVLAALFFLPGIAWGDPVDCAATPTPAGCSVSGGDTAGGDRSANTLPGAGTATGDTAGSATADQPKTDPGTAGGTTGQQPGDPSARKPAGSGLVVPFQVPTTNAGPVVPLLDVQPPDQTVTTPPNFCDQVPLSSLCTGPNPPTGPLTCDQLTTLLNLPGGCPQNFSCDDLAALLGVTCPAGPPDCATLAALFHLQGCPQPPTSCQQFAKMLGVQDCSQIPCLDTSKLPQQARDGLGPLFDGLANIGIKQCPAAPTTGGTTTPPGQGTTMPNQPAALQQQPYYANCTDARAHGASNIPQGSPGYRPELDADHDGFACDEAQPAAAVATAQPTGKLAYTGLELGPQLNAAWTLLVLGAGMLILGRRRA